MLQPLILLSFLPQFAFPQKHLELKDFLKNYYNFSSLPSYNNATSPSGESSYDRRGLNEDHRSFIRRNADSTIVLLDVKGSGVISHIHTPNVSDDSVDFYIDDDTKPSFTVRYHDLFSGNVYPFVAPLCDHQLGGYNCYLPIPFNNSCKIVFRGKVSGYYNIDYNLYEDGTIFKPFSMNLTEEEKACLEKIKNIWNKPAHSVTDFYETQYSTSKKNIFINPNQTLTIFESSNAGRVLGFEIQSASELNKLAKNIDLRITYDNEAIPAVYCPLSDYFGYSFDKASMNGLMVGSDGRTHYSWYPMPYDKSIKIELIYRSFAFKTELNTINLLCKVYTSNKQRDTQKEGKFYAIWNRENPVPAGKPYTFLDVKGKGHVAGVVLQAQGLQTGVTGNWEGDDSLVVDGKLAIHGTGSEDFFNGGWYAILDCWDDAMSLPLSGALEYSIPLARTGGYRFFLNDKLGFKQSLLQTIEHDGEHNLWKTDYTSVSYYYCSQNNKQTIFPNAENTKIYEPDTLELYPQFLPATMDEFLSVEIKWAVGAAKTMFYTIRDKSVIKLSVNKIPPGTYKIYLDFNKQTDGAMFSMWQRQSPISDWIDSYNTEAKRIDWQETGKVSISALNNSFSFRFKTTNDRNKFVLNRIILVKEK